ncbi:unnamed protein product [Allacma fusca]|uniref:Methyltransferase type 11 domain-containing protein n=1 Tax=Allacma fusca TaxID=39272 RepID=A0A8J2LK87_9HEXA|nr:unnamed protein product [Allacma fusca]
MANRYFENENHTKLYQKYRMTAPKALVQRVINYLKEKYSGELELAVDIGCGSGQNTYIVADYFKKVIGIDVSPNQIANAVKANERTNVEFQLGAAEKLNLPDGSVQLITAMAAVHWLDLPKFFEEGLRVLSPGGVMAVYSYFISFYEWPRDPTKNEAIKKFYEEIILEGELGQFWSEPIRKHIFTKYKNISIPYDDFTRDDTFRNERHMSLTGMLGEMQTFSGFQSLREAKGDEAAGDLLDRLKNGILEIIKDDLSPEESNLDEIYFEEKSPLFLLLARKPV